MAASKSTETRIDERAIDPELKNRLTQRIDEVARELHWAYTEQGLPFEPVMKQKESDGSVTIGFKSSGSCFFGTTHSPLASSAIASLIGGGVAVHRRSLSQLPKIEVSNGTGWFASMDDLILCLNAHAKDKSQKIDLPDHKKGHAQG